MADFTDVEITSLNNELLIRTHIDDIFLKDSTSSPSQHVPVLILLAEMDGAPIPSALYKMMEACKLQSHEYRIEQLQAHSSSWPVVIDKYQPNIVIAFGNVAEVLGIQAQFPALQSFWFHNRVWIQVMPITQLLANNEWKTILWKDILQEVFINGKYENQLRKATLT